MTLVQSLLQRLSGNKNILLLVLICIFLAACGGTKKIPSANNGNTQANTNGDIDHSKPKVDTVKWNRISKEEIAPITDKRKVIESQKKDIYSVSILIPFGSKDFDFNAANVDTESDNYRFMNYYAGIKMALFELEEKGMKFHVNVFDTESNNSTINTILRSTEIQNSDAIIGPYDRDKLKLVAEYGKKNEIPVISPWQASTSITDDNPYYVQLRPNLNTYYQAIIQDALENFSTDNIYLIGRDLESDRRRLDRLQGFADDILGEESVNLKEFIVDVDSLQHGETAFDSLFYEDTTTVLIIPNWSFRSDESFIYSCLRKINIEKSLGRVVVYGMPIVIDSDQIDFNFYRNLNVRVARSKFVDIHSENIKSFKIEYYRSYYDIPTKDAYEGYDVMSFVGRNIFEYGTAFQHFLFEDKREYLQMSFDIQKRRKEDSETVDDEDFGYFENLHLDIFEFVEDKFVKLKN